MGGRDGSHKNRVDNALTSWHGNGDAEGATRPFSHSGFSPAGVQRLLVVVDSRKTLTYARIFGK